MNMARNAASACISSPSTSNPPSKPSPRRRPTAPRSSLLAQLGARKTPITTGKGQPRSSTAIEAELADRERERANDAAEADAAAAGKPEKEKARRKKAEMEKGKRAGDADDGGAQSASDGFDVGANPSLMMEMDIRSASTDTDGSVIHHDKHGEEEEEEEEDVHATPRTKLLVEENQALAKRVEALEAETSSLLHTRALEHDRLKSINAALIRKLAHSRASAASACAEARIWEGQMMDREGEVQRLRAMLMELQEEVDAWHGSLETPRGAGSQTVS